MEDYEYDCEEITVQHPHHPRPFLRDVYPADPEELRTPSTEDLQKSQKKSKK